jgi:hypothetical protein
VQPVGREQWQFKYIGLYGLIEPKTGDSFFYEFSHLDSIYFEKEIVRNICSKTSRGLRDYTIR